MPSVGEPTRDAASLALTRIEHRGFEREDRLKVTAVFENAEVLRPAEAAQELLPRVLWAADEGQ